MKLTESRFHWKVRLALGLALGGVVSLLLLAGRRAARAVADRVVDGGGGEAGPWRHIK